MQNGNKCVHILVNKIHVKSSPRMRKYPLLDFNGLRCDIYESDEAS
jgi:hypothetical protein